MTMSLLQNKGVPGFCRRIKLYSSDGMVIAGLEDDMHRFVICVEHANGIVTNLIVRAERFPWSVCPKAEIHLIEEVIGKELSIVEAFDAHSHCTHMLDLVELCAAHAPDTCSIQFDLFVADSESNRTFATLCENGKQVLRWSLDGTIIVEPSKWAGQDLRKFSVWKHRLSPRDAELSRLLRRAVHISGGRRVSDKVVTKVSSDFLSRRMGACFRYQAPQAMEATRSPNWKQDFSLTDVEPLRDFDPVTELKKVRKSP